MKRIVLFGFFIFVFLFGLTKIEDYDFWWHLKAGDYILTQGKIPKQDIFSFTNPKGTEWVIPGWLAGVIFALVKQLSGLKGVVIFKALIIVLSYFFLLRLLLKKKTPFYLTIFILIISVLIARFRFVEIRPYIFKFLFIVLFIYFLEDYRLLRRNKILYPIPLLMLFWANLHGTFFLGLVIIGAYILGEFFEKVFSGDNSISVKPLLLLFIICLFITLLNPYGYRFHQWTFKLFTLTVGGQVIPNEEFLPPKINEYILFWVFLFLGMFSFLLRWFSLGGKRKDLNLTYFFLFLSFVFLAVKARRYIAIFSLVNSLVVVENLNFFSRRYLQEKVVRFKSQLKIFSSLPIIESSLLILMAGLFFFTFRAEKEYQFGLGIKENVYPVKAVEFIEQNNLSGNAYNPEEYGGYLIWKWFPQRKVFIFNDNLLFYNLRKKVYTGTVNVDSEDVFSSYGINWMIKNYTTPGLENYYLIQGNWKLVWWDAKSLVYLKDIPENKDLISKYSYRYVDPLNFNLTFAQTLAQHNFADLALEELAWNIKDNPDNFKAYLFLGYLYESLNDKDKAINSYLLAEKIEPEGGYIHYQIGLRLGKLYLEKNPHLAIKELSLQKKYLPKNPELEFYLGTAYYFIGNYKKALEKFNRSLELNPEQAVVNSNLGFLYLDLVRYQEAITRFKKAIEIDPTYPDPYFGLASVYEKLVEKEDARKNWEKYLTLSKDPRWITIAKEHLKKLTTQGTQK